MSGRDANVRDYTVPVWTERGKIGSPYLNLKEILFRQSPVRRSTSPKLIGYALNRMLHGTREIEYTFANARVESR